MPSPDLAGYRVCHGQAARRPAFLARLVAVCVALLSWMGSVRAMHPGRVAQLRRDTVDMFYHGFDNYMHIAFPEDEVLKDPGIPAECIVER